MKTCGLRIRALIAFSICVVLLLAFGSAFQIRRAFAPIVEKDLYGRYLRAYPFGTQTVVLSPDSTFLQEVFLSREGKTSRITGAWSYDPQHGMVILQNGFRVARFGVLDSSFDKFPQRQTIPIGRRFFNLQLFLEPDEYDAICKVEQVKSKENSGDR